MGDPFEPLKPDGTDPRDQIRTANLTGKNPDPYFGLAGTSSDGEISVLEEIRALIKDHGREVFLRKRTGQRCRCFDPITEEPEVDCPTCSGYGYVYLDHRVKGFKYLVSFPTSAAYRKFIAEFGVMGTDEVIFYIEAPKLQPSLHDVVVEVITDEYGKVKRPLLIERLHDVNQVVDLRENKGRISYWALRTRRKDLGK